MNWVTHVIALLIGIWIGILFALWVVDVTLSEVKQFLNNTPEGK